MTEALLLCRSWCFIYFLYRTWLTFSDVGTDLQGTPGIVWNSICMHPPSGFVSGFVASQRPHAAPRRSSLHLSWLGEGHPSLANVQLFRWMCGGKSCEPTSRPEQSSFRTYQGHSARPCCPRSTCHWRVRGSSFTPPHEGTLVRFALRIPDEAVLVVVGTVKRPSNLTVVSATMMTTLKIC